MTRGGIKILANDLKSLFQMESLPVLSDEQISLLLGYYLEVVMFDRFQLRPGLLEGIPVHELNRAILVLFYSMLLDSRFFALWHRGIAIWGFKIF